MTAANCSTSPQEGFNNPKAYKRQTLQQLQCIAVQMDAYFQGNTSTFVTQCKNAAMQPIWIKAPSNAVLPLPQELEPVLEAYCTPECGTAMNNALNQCGVYSSFYPGIERFYVDLCGTSENGMRCYTLYDKAYDLIQTATRCIQTLSSTGMCTCQSELTAGVDQQGCCTDIYLDFLQGVFDYSPRALFRQCQVAFPTEGCNNSPIDISDSISHATNNNFMPISVTIAAVVISLSTTWD